MNYTGYYESPLGVIKIIADDTAVYKIEFSNTEEILPEDNSNNIDIIKLTISQLNDYFTQTLRLFTIPIKLEGTNFQKSVWAELLKIPYGYTISYGELASKMGDINAVRAVGTANSLNPIAILVPCHRVIGANGELTGYSGEIWRKQWLLEHEGGIRRLF